MLKNLTLLVLVIGLSGCGMFKRAFGVGDTSEIGSATTTSILGDWVLATPADSTGFAGATQVELSLDASSFTLTASYPGRAPVVIRGAASRATDGGLLTLTPQSGGGAGIIGWTAGEPVTVVASAADNALVFAAPHDLTGRPTSVWHKRGAAVRAGRVNPPAAPPQR
jgi:hypothetical protein